MLEFARMLVVAGEYTRARDLFADAMTYDTQTPDMQVHRAIVAIELAHAIDDKELLKRSHDDVVELAFRSGEPRLIGLTVAAYVKTAIANGQTRRARALIERGMSVIRSAQFVDMLALAARYGTPATAMRARELLLRRMALPHHRVAQAYLALWEAYDARRRRAAAEGTHHAQRAARFFARLGWKHQQADALALAGKAPLGTSDQRRVVGDRTQALTTRERQVAELILRGFTNRSIAQSLSITEHTVESHVTSILNRMGLRSRWQLAGGFQDA
jgi:DNA-binding CsgD family transcriptional regulator